jgi:dihydroneopterin aldolase
MTADAWTCTISVRDLVLEARIGVHAHERGGPQRVRVDVEADVVLDRPPADAIRDVVSYELLAAAAREEAGAGHVDLAETLADRIAARCLAEPRIRAVRVRVEKPDALPGGVVGVRLERRRPGS